MAGALILQPTTVLASLALLALGWNVVAASVYLPFVRGRVGTRGPMCQSLSSLPGTEAEMQQRVVDGIVATAAAAAPIVAAVAAFAARRLSGAACLLWTGLLANTALSSSANADACPEALQPPHAPSLLPLSPFPRQPCTRKGK
jgi:hypothetical protein